MFLTFGCILSSPLKGIVQAKVKILSFIHLFTLFTPWSWFGMTSEWINNDRIFTAVKFSEKKTSINSPCLLHFWLPEVIFYSHSCKLFHLKFSNLLILKDKTQQAIPLLFHALVYLEILGYCAFITCLSD